MNGDEPGPFRRALFAYDDCRAVDRLSIERGFPEPQLMGQAALASLYQLEIDGLLDRPGRLLILCGSGNNGGDGLALAYMLLGRDPAYRNRLRVFRTDEGKSPASRLYTRQLEELGVEFLRAEDFLAEKVEPEDVIIEALLGIGQAFTPRAGVQAILNRLAQWRAEAKRPTLVALDVPAGLREDQPVRFVPPGRSSYVAAGSETMFPTPDYIHSYGVDKIAVRLNPDLAAHSRVRVLPMGFHPAALKTADRIELMDDAFAAEVYRKGPTSHKYSSGHGVLVGGSPTMEGAALLASRSFFAAGGGILRTLVPGAESRGFLTAAEPTVMFLDLESPSINQAMEEILPAALALGPGLRPSDLERFQPTLLSWLARLAGTTKPPWLVLDAGALPLIASSDYPEALRARTICTPHTGEWRRLVKLTGGDPTGREPGCVAGLGQARDYNSSHFRCWMLIKDAVSVLLPPDDEQGPRVFSRPSGNLAVAGSGDVLTGVLLAVLSRRRSYEMGMAEAARLAQMLHAEAGALEVNAESARFPELIRRRLAEK